MNEQAPREEILHLFKEIEASPTITQRDLSTKLSISLGKINYLLKALIKRGSISIKNFYTHDGKLKKTRYILTRKGLDERMQLTQHFLERKEIEYYRMKEEWERLKTNNTNKQVETENLSKDSIIKAT